MNRNVNLNVNTANSSLYIGGMPTELFQDGYSLPSVVNARTGFVGSLASFQLNDAQLGLSQRLPNFARPNTEVVPGSMTIQKSDCRKDPCGFSGVCVEEYQSFSCICEMTSLEGAQCTQESYAFKFDSERQYSYAARPGFVRYSLIKDRQPNTLKDRLAFAFRTTSLKKGGRRTTVLHIIGAKQPGQPHPDFIRVDVMWDRVEVHYNMGVDTVTMGWSPPFDRRGLQNVQSYTVNDGKWHVVRFKRTGPNASLQVDEHAEIVRSPQGMSIIFRYLFCPHLSSNSTSFFSFFSLFSLKITKISISIFFFNLINTKFKSPITQFSSLHQPVRNHTKKILKYLNSVRVISLTVVTFFPSNYVSIFFWLFQIVFFKSNKKND